MEAIEEAWSEAGVAILVDLGGAETNSEMAIEMIGEPRSGRIVICNAPIVEGAVMAATEASGGATLKRWWQRRRNCRRPRTRTARASVSGRRRERIERPGRMARRLEARMTTSAEATVLITHEVGLHARPSVKFTKLAKTFAARSRWRSPPRARGSTPRASSR